MRRPWYLLFLFPLIVLLVAATTQIDWNSQIKNKPSLWNDPGSGTILKRSGAFTFAAAVSGTDYQAPLGFTPENSANKGAVNGYAGLDASSLVPVINLRACAEGASHTAGQVPDPGSVAGTTKFFREDCTFSLPPVFVASGASHAIGYVPDPGASSGTTHFLREDASWQNIGVSFNFSCSGALTAAATLYIQPGFGAACTDTNLVDGIAYIPFPATATSLFIATNNGNAVHNIVATLLKNNAATLVTCTILAGSSTCSDTAHTASYNGNGDYMQVQVVTLAGETTGGVHAAVQVLQ